MLHFSVRNFGALGDGQADDTLALNACVATAAVHGGIVDFEPGTYRLQRRVNGGQGPAILLTRGVSLDGHGCTLMLDGNCSYVGAAPDMAPRAEIDRDVHSGARNVHVDSSAPFLAGDPIGIRLGDNAWDTHETREMFFTSIRRVVDAHTLLLANPLPQGVEVTHTTPPNRAVLRFRAEDNPVYCDGFIRNFNLQRTPRGNPESGIDFRCANNVDIENITASDPGAGVVLLAYCRNVRVRHIRCERSIAIGGHPAKGRIINVWNSEDCDFDDFEGHSFAGPFAFFESYCHDLRCTDWRIFDDWSARMHTPRPNKFLLMLVQGSSATFNNLRIVGDGEGEVVTDSGGTPSGVEIRGLTIEVSGALKALDIGQVSAGPLMLGGQTYGALKRAAARIELQPRKEPFSILTIPRLAQWHKVTVEGLGLTTKQRLMVGRQTVDLSPENAKAEIPSLVKIGSDYPHNPPPDGNLTVETSALSEKIEAIVTVEYYPMEEKERRANGL